MATTTIRINEKYTVLHEHGTNLRATRYDEPWRDLVGDGLVLAMAQLIEDMAQEIVKLQKQLAVIKSTP